MVAASPDRVRCMELLIKLLNSAEPTKIHVSIDPLRSLLSRLLLAVEYPQAQVIELPFKQPSERTISIPLEPSKAITSYNFPGGGPGVRPIGKKLRPEYKAALLNLYSGQTTREKDGKTIAEYSSQPVK
jgi:hypothetical protein